MSTYVLVPGMNHGGWCFDDPAQRLRAEGHTVHALTLPGLAPGDDVSGVNLETHIAAAAAVEERAWYVDDDGSGFAGESPLQASYERVRDDPAWEVHVLDSRHNVTRDVPEKLAAILLDVAS